MIKGGKGTATAEQARAAAMDTQRERVARELHDVVFTFGKPIPTFDRCQTETQAWFRARASRLLEMLAVESGDE